MSSSTTNYNLTKPAGTDYVDIDDINGNMDVIDATMKQNADGIAALGESVSRTTDSVTYGANVSSADTRFSILEKSGHTVHLSVPLSTSASKAKGSTILTLPDGYRPGHAFYFQVLNNGSMINASIDTSGVMTLESAWSSAALWVNVVYLCD